MSRHSGLPKLHRAGTLRRHPGGVRCGVHAHRAGTDYRPAEAFAGRIFHASLANVAVDGTAAAKPLNQVLDASRGMLVDIRAQGGTVADATGRHTLQTGGVTAIVTGVDSSLVVPGSK